MKLTVFDDSHFMKQALIEARHAAELGEVPVGAIVVFENQIIARAHNSTERMNDVTAHAEIIAITAAAEAMGSKYLKNCTLYVTLEPCVMCAGALAWAQVGRVVYGAQDDKSGYFRHGNLLHPKTKVALGVMQEECKQLMKDFFAARR